MSGLTETQERLEAFHRDLRTHMEKLKAESPLDAIRMYVRVKEQYDEFETARKQLYATLEGYSRNFVPEVLAEQQLKFVPFDDMKRRVGTSVRVSCSIQDDKKDQAYDWLRQNKAGDLIKPTVNAGVLSSFAKSYTEDTGRDLPPDLFKISSLTVTSITKLK